MSKYVYFFGGGKADGRADMKDLLGGKGANLAEMTNIGLPVPAGFTITTEVCTYFYAHQHQYPAELKDQVQAAMRQTEALMGANFGDPKNPLLVSCRSGARVSMPGMMDTVLNIGLNEATLKGLIDKTGNERFAWDSYRRFVQMYGDVVLGLKPQTKTEIDPFEAIMDEVKHARGVKHDTELNVADLKELVKRLQEGGQGSHRQGLPRRRLRSDVGRHRRRLRLVEQRSGRRLSPAVRLLRTTGALPPTSAPWSSATWAMTAAPAWPSPAIRPPARRSSTANT